MLSLSSLLSLQTPLRLASIVTIASLFLASPVTAQTYTKCNPTEGTCSADTALGGSVSVNFVSGASSDFSASGTAPTYDSNGVSFTVAKSGDAPVLTSNWYIMFGKVEVVLKAAPGQGIVSSSVLQSDDLDEIDWEWIGDKDDQVQSNYFGKGQTTGPTRGAVHAVSGTDDGFHTYTVEWTSTQIVWQIDGTTVRVLLASNADGMFPQTPMQLKLGAWSGGDPSNAAGTIAWAGGLTDYAAGPYTMVVKSVSAQDYSTGTSYSYGDTSGLWTSIKSNGGTINGGSTGTTASAPAITSTSSGDVAPFEGTHRSESSTSTPGIGSWEAATTLATATSTATSLAGLPSGWTVNSSGKVVPPSSAASSTYPLASSTSSPQVSPQASCSASAAEGGQLTTMFNEQGFLTTVAVAIAPESYNEQGFLITPSAVLPAGCAATAQADAQAAGSTTTAAVLVAAEDNLATSSSSSSASATPTLTNGAGSVGGGKGGSTLGTRLVWAGIGILAAVGLS